jgi:hypothetical protein
LASKGDPAGEGAGDHPENGSINRRDLAPHQDELAAFPAGVDGIGGEHANLGEARGGGGGGHGHASNYCTICARDIHGRIARSPEARQEFMTQTGYPHGRPGYVVDHIIPLKRGGADEPWNMQWQTIAEGKAKDATE